MAFYILLQMVLMAKNRTIFRKNEIFIPQSYEITYINKFIKPLLEKQLPVELNGDFVVKELSISPVPILRLEIGLDLKPVLSLFFRYYDEEIALGEKKIVL